MKSSPFDSERFFKSACLFEASLIIVAVVLGWLAGINPFAGFHASQSAILFGILGTVPLFLLFLLLQQLSTDSVVSIRRMLLETLAPGLVRCNWADLFILAAIAGVSEEVLFRGFLQPWFETSFGVQAGLIGSNLIFGLVHAITPLYTVLAALVGVYLGLALDYGGERNLWVPVIIHGLYDFLAFLVIMKSYKDMLSSKS
ncbi:MAG: CPBP family intramembrane metalloprotease [Methylococcaceae bacterium]|nr:CPBP family intramembrane metalloprotease [Methylococcaceae bacterium]